MTEDLTKTENKEEIEKKADDNKRTIDDLDAEKPEKTEKKKKRKHARRKYDDDLPPENENKSSDDDEKDDEVDDDKLIIEDDEEDDLAEIDSTNIITTGRRTRGKVIDYSKVSEELNKEGKSNDNEDEDEDDEDVDFKDAEK